MASAPPLYRIEGLTKIYGEGETAIAALRGVDLDVPASAMVVLLGPSGSGKSTFPNIVGGLDRVSERHVHFEELQLTAREHAALITEIAEDPMDLAFGRRAAACRHRQHSILPWVWGRAHASCGGHRAIRPDRRICSWSRCR